MMDRTGNVRRIRTWATLNVRNNPDGQSVTTYGNLSAYNVPYVVVPDSYVRSKGIPRNAISAVICNGQMYYAIMGDTNGNTPEVIGEASWLLGQTCFPNDGLDGANAHSKTDVLCHSSSANRQN